MRIPFYIFTYLWLLSSSRAGDFQFWWTDTGLNPGVVRSVALFPQVVSSTGPNSFLTLDPVIRFTDIHGGVVFSNIQAGTYMAVYVGTVRMTTNWYSFPQTNGYQQATNWISNSYIFPGSRVPAYSTTQSDARYWQMKVLQAGANTTFRTNGNQVFIDSQAGGGSGNFNGDLTTSSNLPPNGVSAAGGLEGQVLGIQSGAAAWITGSVNSTNTNPYIATNLPGFPANAWWCPSAGPMVTNAGVQTLPELSGHGWDLTNRGTAALNWFKAGNALNGLATISSAPSGSRYLASQNYTSSQPHEVAMMVHYIGPPVTVGNDFFDSFNTSYRNTYTLHSGGVSWIDAGNAGVTGGLMPTGWFMLDAVFNGVSSALYTNGVLDTIGNAGAFGMSGFVLGDYGDLAGSFNAVIEVAEIATYNAVLDSSARATLKASWFNKYGLSVSQGSSIANASGSGTNTTLYGLTTPQLLSADPLSQGSGLLNSTNFVEYETRLNPFRQNIYSPVRIPPLGFMSWYSWGCGVTESLWTNRVKLFKQAGLYDYGYQWMLLSDGAFSSNRSASGGAMLDTNKFSNSLKWHIDFCHTNGFKFGIYHAVALSGNCGGAPFYNAATAWQDATNDVAMGVDHVFLDAASPYGATDTFHEFMYRTFVNAAQQYSAAYNLKMPYIHITGEYYEPAGSTVLSNNFAPWMSDYANDTTLQPMTGFADSENGDEWTNTILRIHMANAIAGYTRPGFFHWPDWTSRGDTNALIRNVNLSAIMGQPIILGEPFGSPNTCFIFTNAEVLAINQDMAVQPHEILFLTNSATSMNEIQVYRKRLQNGDFAIGVLNRHTNAADAATTLTLSSTQLQAPGTWSVREPWAKTNFTLTSAAPMTLTVAPRECKLFRFSVPVVASGGGVTNNQYLPGVPVANGQGFTNVTASALVNGATVTNLTSQSGFTVGGGLNFFNSPWSINWPGGGHTIALQGSGSAGGMTWDENTPLISTDPGTPFWARGGIIGTNKSVNQIYLPKTNSIAQFDSNGLLTGSTNFINTGWAQFNGAVTNLSQSWLFGPEHADHLFINGQGPNQVVGTSEGGEIVPSVVTTTNLSGQIVPSQIAGTLSNSISAASVVASFTGNGAALTNIPPSAIVSNGTYLANGVVTTNSGLNGGFVTETGDKRKLTLDGGVLTNLQGGQIVGSLPTGLTPIPGTFYISPTGNDSNDGLTTLTPKTYLCISTTLQADATIYMMDGVYSQSFQIIKTSTNAIPPISGHPATLKALHKWKAIIANTGSGNQGIQTFLSPFTIYDGLCVSNNANAGIKLNDTNCVIRNCWITHNGNGAVDQSGVDSSGGSFELIERNLVEFSGNGGGQGHGLYVAGTNSIIRGNVIRNNGGYGCQVYSDSYRQDQNYVYDNLTYGNGTVNYGFAIYGLDGNTFTLAGTNYFYNNTVLDGMLVLGGGVFITNNIVLPKIADPTLPIRQSGGHPPSTYFAGYNLGTNAFTPAGLNDIITNVQRGVLFANITNGLYWLSVASPARSWAIPGIAVPVDFFGNAQSSVSDIGAFQFNGALAGDTRVLDPSPSTGADYWLQPGVFTPTNLVTGSVTASGVFTGNGAGLTNLLTPSVFTNMTAYGSGAPAIALHGGFVATNDVTGTSVIDTNGVLSIQSNSVVGFRVDSAGAMSLSSINATGGVINVFGASRFTNTLTASGVITSTNGFLSYATNYLQAQAVTGFTNSAVAPGIGGTNTMLVNVQSTSGTLELYWKSGTGGQTVCGQPIVTNTLFAGWEQLVIPVNCGFVIRSGVGIRIDMSAF